MTTPYVRFDEDDLILRDHLAADRTMLANERTLLAYVRTALTLIIVGVSLLKLFESKETHIIAWILIPCGMVMAVIGLVRFYKMKKMVLFKKNGTCRKK